MKVLITISMLLWTAVASGQADVNQETEQGQKTGKWVYLHENGKIDEVHYYKPVKRAISRGEAFFYGMELDQAPILYYEELLWSEKYQYSPNWELKRIKRDERSKEIRYLYGPNKEIGLKTGDFYFIERVGSSKTVSIGMTNNTNYPIRLNPVFSATNMTTDQPELVLPPNQASSFTFSLKIEPDEHVYSLALKNDSIAIDFSVQAYGYNIESKDIEGGQPLVLKKRFIYHRTGSEALLKLYHRNKKKELKTISLARQRTIVDLGKAKPGSYWLCIVDYSANKRTFCEVRIEK